MVDAVTYVTYVVVRVPMSRMWWRLNLCHLCGGVWSPMWWRLNLCHLCGGVWSSMSPMWWRLNLCHLCGGVCPYVTYVVAF